MQQRQRKRAGIHVWVSHPVYVDVHLAASTVMYACLIARMGRMVWVRQLAVLQHGG